MLTWHQMPTERMGPPPGASPPMRMTASGSGSERTYRIQVCGAKMRPNGELPSDLHRQAGTVRQTGALQKSPVAVHHRSAGSGVKALRNTSVARRQAAKLGSRFGPLTPSARSANLIAGDGTKNGLSRSEQKTVSTTQNNRLTGKAPYKFESISLQRGVGANLASSPCGRGRRLGSTSASKRQRTCHDQMPWHGSLRGPEVRISSPPAESHARTRAGVQAKTPFRGA